MGSGGREHTMRIRADKTIVKKKLTQELLVAGVPVVRDVALLPNNGLEIPLVNEDEAGNYMETINTVIEAHDGIDVEANSKANRHTAAIAVLASIAGRNITTINNTADRDALMQAICYELGICDEFGFILADPNQTIRGK